MNVVKVKRPDILVLIKTNECIIIDIAILGQSKIQEQEIAEINRIAIYSHLTPRLQELLHSAKAHQNTYNYKWCWAKGAVTFLRRTDSSMAIRLRSIDDLTKLRLREHPEARSEDPCS